MKLPDPCPAHSLQSGSDGFDPRRSEIPDVSPREAPVLPVALTLALAAHAAVGLISLHAPPRRAAAPTLEVDLTVPVATAKPPLPPPEPAPEPKPAAAEPPALAPRNAPARAARAPAAAGKLLTAEPSSNSDAPVDFVTDPNGTVYGYGVVARGGTSTGQGGRDVPDPQQQTPALAPAPAGPALVSSADLSEQPRLVADDPCSGFYPGDATADSASAVVRVVLTADGRVKSLSLVSETPAAQGFGRAATQCLRSQRFTSALDRDGHKVATATTIRVRFHR